MKPTETEVDDSPDDILGEIGLARRRAIHEADSKYDTLMEESGKAFREACVDLGHLITCSPDVMAMLRDLKDAKFRRLLDKIKEADVAVGEAYVGLQGEHERIEDKFNKLTVEFFAKNPHPIITTLEQRIEAARANETPKGKINPTNLTN